MGGALTPPIFVICKSYINRGRGFHLEKRIAIGSNDFAFRFPLTGWPEAAGTTVYAVLQTET